jgi:hypothetical protein
MIMADNHEATHVSQKADFWTTEQYSQKVAPFVAQLTTRVVEMLNPKSDGIRSAGPFFLLPAVYPSFSVFMAMSRHVSSGCLNTLFHPSQLQSQSLKLGQCSRSLELMLFLY